MLVSHECPISLLEKSRQFNDYDYALVHLFEENKAYFNFFKQSVEMGRHVILDNSIFELGTAFDSKRYAYWINELKPTEYIIPDALENYSQTIINARQFVKNYPNLPGKRIAVVQGKSYEELTSCYTILDKELNIEKLAISFDYSYYKYVTPHPNKWMAFVNGRVNTMSRLLNDGFINTKKPHHLLGCALPIEFLFYREGFDWIETIDTSSPIVHGLLDIGYEPGGLVSKQSIKLVDLLGATPTPEQMNLINHNLAVFRSYAQGLK